MRHPRRLVRDEPRDIRGYNRRNYPSDNDRPIPLRTRDTSITIRRVTHDATLDSYPCVVIYDGFPLDFTTPAVISKRDVSDEELGVISGDRSELLFIRNLPSDTKCTRFIYIFYQYQI